MKTKQDRAALTGGTERRAYPVQLEVRQQAGGTVKLDGYASVTEQVYEMWDWLGPYGEIVRLGAFTKTLSENPATQLLLNHGGLSMAYTRAGTLRLAEDSTGLHMTAEVNTARTDVRDMVTAIEDGNVDEMSFAFRVLRQQWSPDYDQRDILEVDIHRGDVSVVNFGANPATSVQAMRALQVPALSRSSRFAEVARSVLLQRAGTTLTAATIGQLYRVLGLVATADDADTEAKAALAELLGLAQPDDTAPEPAESSVYSLLAQPQRPAQQRETAPLALYLAQAQALDR
ncbi:HK97 family phage prohead protease [Actinocrispum wychmicini]|uniref:Prohead serine protease domain-containing protein n=1 Tax=Actinocrispum wychmicini TaxID=1213861 RepID=A0A4R2K539_9PSEU|nr:HK97 family phage prohead protease [Actinocrispum wychmicini]TCO64946.1 hypothetical protein EV192_101730 [Actinocrispum wychmicini]